MTEKRIYTDYLENIHDSSERIRKFTTGMTFEQFTGDDNTAFAVIRALEIIVEATKKILLSWSDPMPGKKAAQEVSMSLRLFWPRKCHGSKM